MDEKKFKEIYKKEGIDFLISLKNCDSVDDVVVFLGKKGINVQRSEAGKIFATINSFRFDEASVGNKIPDDKLGGLSGGVGQFADMIFSSLLCLNEKEIHE